MSVKISLPKKLKFLFRPSRYKVPYGGRGSAKSWTVAKALVILGSSCCVRILCGREYQKSIADSVHKLLSDQIQRMGFSAHYQITLTSIRNPYTGTEIIFEGLHNNVAQIKSLEGVNIVWVEEAESVTKASWETLIPTIRTPWLAPLWYFPSDTEFTYEEIEAGLKQTGSEIWVTYNPNEETDNTHQRFVINPPPDSVVRMINYTDNKWFPEELRKEMEYLKRIDYEDYLHIWMGQCTKKSAAQVLRGKWKVESFEPVASVWDGPYYGVDWGFAVDPSVMVRFWIFEARLWIEYESYGLGVENDDLPTLFDRIPLSREYVSRADCSRPETISHLRRHGYPKMVAGDKWPGSVEDGINYLRGTFEEIIIHPRCVETAQEARLWSYKIDKNTGDILPVLEDKNNHCWDGIRYGLAPLIKNNVAFAKKWWRYLRGLTAEELPLTMKMVTMTTDEMQEGSAELGAVLQHWGLVGASGMCLLAERVCWGTIPDLMQEAVDFWSLFVDQRIPTTELWIDNKSMGQTMLRSLRQKGLPAREWDPEDKMVVDPSYRSKQSSVHISDGRIFVPENASVITEIQGLSTNAMTLAIMIWQQRGGGKGPLPSIGFDAEQDAAPMTDVPGPRVKV